MTWIKAQTGQLQPLNSQNAAFLGHKTQAKSKGTVQSEHAKENSSSDPAGLPTTRDKPSIQSPRSRGKAGLVFVLTPAEAISGH